MAVRQPAPIRGPTASARNRRPSGAARSAPRRAPGNGDADDPAPHPDADTTGNDPTDQADGPTAACRAWVLPGMGRSRYRCRLQHQARPAQRCAESRSTSHIKADGWCDRRSGLVWRALPCAKNTAAGVLQDRLFPFGPGVFAIRLFLLGMRPDHGIPAIGEDRRQVRAAGYPAEIVPDSVVVRRVPHPVRAAR